MNMRNATCVGTETSKVPTRVALLFIFYFVVRAIALGKTWSNDSETPVKFRVRTRIRILTSFIMSEFRQMNLFIPATVPVT